MLVKISGGTIARLPPPLVASLQSIITTALSLAWRYLQSRRLRTHDTPTHFRQSTLNTVINQALFHANTVFALLQRIIRCSTK